MKTSKPIDFNLEIPLLREVFRLLHKEIDAEKDKRIASIKSGQGNFQNLSSRLATVEDFYGFKHGKDNPLSIRAFMAEQFEGNEQENFKRGFNGKRLYEYYRESKANKSDYILVDKRYLEVYLKFIQCTSFDSFINTREFEEAIRSRQQELVVKFSRGLVSPDENVTPSLYFGVFEGFYLRPVVDKRHGDSLLKLYLLICPGPDYKVTVKTSTVDTPYFGNHSRPNNSVVCIEFGLENQSIGFSFILETDLTPHESTFLGYLRGVYAGQDPISRKPAAGRIFLKQIKTWEQVMIEAENDSVEDYFVNSKKYGPSSFSSDRAFHILKPDDLDDEVLLSFFKDENEFMENTAVIENLVFNKPNFINLVGSYSVYSLRSNGETIDISPAMITEYGHIFLNGSTDSKGKVKVFEGQVYMIGGNKVYFLNRLNSDNENCAFYMLQVDASSQNIGNYFHGVRIIQSDSNSYPPVACRVIFQKQAFQDSYYPEKFMDQIPLHPSTPKESMKRLAFIKNHEPIYQYLSVPENNLLITPSAGRIPSIGQLPFYEASYIAAKYFADNGNRKKAKLYIQKAIKQGYSDYGELLRSFDWLKDESNIWNENFRIVDFSDKQYIYPK